MSAPATVETAAPECDECAVGMAQVGRGDHRYWSCGYCGSTLPIRP